MGYKEVNILRWWVGTELEVVFTSAVLLSGQGNRIYLWKNHLMGCWSYGHLETVFYVDNCTEKDS